MGAAHPLAVAGLLRLLRRIVPANEICDLEGGERSIAERRLDYIEDV
jgi:hypothetical protein